MPDVRASSIVLWKFCKHVELDLNLKLAIDSSLLSDNIRLPSVPRCLHVCKQELSLPVN